MPVHVKFRSTTPDNFLNSNFSAVEYFVGELTITIRMYDFINVQCYNMLYHCKIKTLI